METTHVDVPKLASEDKIEFSEMHWLTLTNLREQQQKQQLRVRQKLRQIQELQELQEKLRALQDEMLGKQMKLQKELEDLQKT